MWRNRLVCLLTVSVLLHIGLWCFIQPELVYRDENFFLYSWGEVPDFLNQKNTVKLALSSGNDEFIIPAHKPDQVYFGKINMKSNSRDKPRADKLSFEINGRNIYKFAINKNDIFIEPPFLLNGQPIVPERFTKKNRMRIKVLVSPRGRVVSAQKKDFEGTFFLRCNLEEKVRGLVLPAQENYYWKDIEVEIK